VKLKGPTSPKWLPHALEHFDEVLIDHAHCEKKAAANALSLLQVYPDVPGLPAQMARLAREESSHLAKVLALMEERGLTLGRDAGDPYAKGLQELLRHGSRERRLDRLLVAGIIEARSHERLQLLADGLLEPGLRRLYAELAKSEDGHQKLLVRLAKGVEPAAEVDARLDALLVAEAQLVAKLPIRAAIH
jgi:tRNA-(ms[2]io[6]A)-hydroxylase